MMRPVLKTYSAPKQANARQTFTVTLTVEDLELIYGTEDKYASAANTELYTGEEGII